MNWPEAAVLIAIIIGLAYGIPAWRAAGRI